MPQLNPLDWGPQLIWLAHHLRHSLRADGVVALPRIGGVIEARRPRSPRISPTAERLRRETEEAIAAYEQALAEAKQKAHAIVEEGRAKLKAETAAERAKLESELAKKAPKPRRASRRPRLRP